MRFLCLFAAKLFFFIAATPLLQAQDSFSIWPSAPLRAESLRTIQGKRIGASGVTLTTAERLDPNSGADLYKFGASPSEPPLDWVAETTVRGRRIDRLGSEPALAETFSLGNALTPAPPPPDWARSAGGSAAWSPADTAQPGALDPWLPNAGEVWLNASATKAAPTDREEGIIRQSLLVPGGRIERAILRVAGRAEFLEIRVNGMIVLTGGARAFAVGEFDVTPLTRTGANIVAVRVQAPAGELVRRPSAAFHLEVWTAPAAPNASDPRPWQIGGCLAVQRDGSRLWGHLGSIDETAVRMSAVFGDAAIAWADIDALYFPDGWRPASNEPARKGWLAKMMRPGGGANSVEPPSDYFGAPLTLEPVGLRGKILLKDGRAVRGTPAFYGDGKLAVQTTTGRRVEINADQVVAIYPDPAAETGQVQPLDFMAPLYARVTTTDGDDIRGVARRLYSRGALLETAGGDFLKVPTDSLMSVAFTQAGVRKTVRGARPARLGILGRAIGLDEFKKDYARLSLELQRAAALAGVEPVAVPLAKLERGALDPAEYAVVALIDPAGEYPDTLGGEKGDARRAMADYVKRGGRLLIYSRGGALRAAIVEGDNGLERTVLEDGLGRDLEIETHTPGDEGDDLSGNVPAKKSGQVPIGNGASGNGLSGQPLLAIAPTASTPLGNALPAAPALSGPAQAFERLPSGAQTPILQLADGGRELDLAFAETYRLAPGGEPTYSPMIATRGPVRTMIALRSPGGQTLGPALQAIDRGQGRVVIIDDLLWRAESDGVPFHRQGLPALLAWMAY